VRVSVSTDGLALGCKLEGLGAGCVYGGLVVFSFVVAVAAAGFVVFGLSDVLDAEDKVDLRLTYGSHCAFMFSLNLMGTNLGGRLGERNLEERLRVRKRGMDMFIYWRSQGKRKTSLYLSPCLLVTSSSVQCS
jgi:hypothetical protein